MPSPALLSTLFGALRIVYDDRVLAPRAWTTMQSGWAVELGRHTPPGPILELGCGAGHIGLTAALGTRRRLVQVDSDPAACALARANAAAAGLGGDVEVRCATAALAAAPGESFPLVVADPPYLPSPLVRRYPEDPVGAIDGGPDGLAVARTFVAAVDAVLPRGGAALVQVWGERQAVELEQELPPGLELAETRRHDGERAVALLRRTRGNGRYGGHGRW